MDAFTLGLKCGMHPRSKEKQVWDATSRKSQRGMHLKSEESLFWDATSRKSQHGMHPRNTKSKLRMHLEILDETV